MCITYVSVFATSLVVFKRIIRMPGDRVTYGTYFYRITSVLLAYCERFTGGIYIRIRYMCSSISHLQIGCAAQAGLAVFVDYGSQDNLAILVS